MTHLTTHQMLYREQMDVAISRAYETPNRPLIELAMGHVQVAYRTGVIDAETAYGLRFDLAHALPLQTNGWLGIDKGGH
jgi:hypothetical protein